MPAGFVYVVRDIDALEQTGTAGATMVLVGQTGAFIWLAGGLTGPAVGNWAFRGRQVYAEGEQVAVKSTLGTWAVSVSGYQLSLP